MNNKIAFFGTLLCAQFLLVTTKAAACESQTDNSRCVEVAVHDTKGQAVSNMVVYLQPLAGQQLIKSSEVVTISQRDKAFSPYITVSQTEKQVSFANQDDITHQIYSADRDNKFSFKIRAGAKHVLEKFDHQAEIAMGCNIHDWMSGHLLVVDTPFFGKTDSNGKISFSLNELGQYRVVVWHPQLLTDNHRLSQELNVLNNSVLTFSLPKNLESIPTQENTDDFDFISEY